MLVRSHSYSTHTYHCTNAVLWMLVSASTLICSDVLISVALLYLTDLNAMDRQYFKIFVYIFFITYFSFFFWGGGGGGQNWYCCFLLKWLEMCTGHFCWCSAISDSSLTLIETHDVIMRKQLECFMLCSSLILWCNTEIGLVRMLCLFCILTQAIESREADGNFVWPIVEFEQCGKRARPTVNPLFHLSNKVWDHFLSY